MSALLYTATGWARWPGPLAFRAPPDLRDSLRALGPVATARVKQRFLDALRGTGRKRPAGGGGPDEPLEGGGTAWSHWDDPTLWILMMH